MSTSVFVYTVNFGRGYTFAQLLQNMNDVMDRATQRPLYVLGIQELDEADSADEHATLLSILKEKVSKAGWATYEPIILSADIDYKGQSVRRGAKGIAHVGPTRHIVSAKALINGKKIVFINQHPMINRPVAAKSRAGMRVVHKVIVRYWLLRGYSVVNTGDMNDTNYPLVHKNEQTAYHKGLDYVRFLNNRRKGAAFIEVAKSGSVDMNIDGHNAGWAKLQVS